MGIGGVGGADRISCLPDDLLHRILLLLPSTTDAVCTSVLSRRWRNVWKTIPELSFRYRWEHESTCDRARSRVDAALASYSQAQLPVRRLEVIMPSRARNVTAEHVASWLSFASQRLTGELHLELPAYGCPMNDEWEVLLPLCERATSIGIDLMWRTLRLQLPSAGAFQALDTLRITQGQMDYCELGDMVSSRCPNLKKLVLELITQKDGASPMLSISSASLDHLEIAMLVDGGQIEVAAPNLQTIHVPYMLCNFYIVAPKLSEVCWGSSDYDPSRHRFAEAGHHLRRLEIRSDSLGSALMKRFNTVDELSLSIHVNQDVEDYRRFLEDMNDLARCEVLVVKFKEIKHAYKATMIHLLRKCTGLRKLVVHTKLHMDEYPCKMLSGCPCSLLENRKTNKIVLDLLEEVEIKGDGKADHKVELVRLLCKCSATSQKRMAITVSGDAWESEYIGVKIRSIVPPSRKVEVTILSLRT